MMNESSITRWLAPPDPQGPVTCAECGCRLTEVSGFDGQAWRHFPSLHPGQDARGCRTRCVDRFHARDGLPSEMLDQLASLVTEREAGQPTRRSERDVTRAEDAAAA